MGTRRNTRGPCVRSGVVALFSTAFVGAILNIWSYSGHLTAGVGHLGASATYLAKENNDQDDRDAGVRVAPSLRIEPPGLLAKESKGQDDRGARRAAPSLKIEPPELLAKENKAQDDRGASASVATTPPPLEIEPRPEPPRRRVAVCFFGLTRSLRWTLPSIEKRLLGVLRDRGMQVEVFLHTYDLLEVNNERAGEVGIGYAKFKNDHHALNANRTLVTDQDQFDRAWPDPLSLTRYHWNYRMELDSVIRNVFRAYWSMATVWSMVVQYSMETGARYDAVVLARPDVWFHVDTDLPKREFPLPERSVFLPSFETDQGGGGRKNDRFAYGSMTAMGIMMNRIATLTDPKGDIYGGVIDSEWVVGHHLMLNNVKVETMDFSVTRVRLTGDIPLYDHGRVEAACQSGEDPMACEMVRLGYKFPIEGLGL